jgi:hypothetical protein
MNSEKAAGISLGAGDAATGDVPIAAFVNIGAGGLTIWSGDGALDIATVRCAGNGTAGLGGFTMGTGGRGVAGVAAAFGVTAGDISHTGVSIWTGDGAGAAYLGLEAEWEQQCEGDEGGGFHDD